MKKPAQNKNERQPKLLIKNMVCPRCISSVQSIFERLDIPVNHVDMGEVFLPEKPSEAQLNELGEALNAVGFELIETRVHKLVSDIKRLVTEYVDLGPDNENLKLSAYITKHLPYDYSYLSSIFSSIEGKTIENYFINRRIEKVKELLVYDQLSLTEIAYRTGFSSVHHLSAQFKKVTGLTPSYFKKPADKGRRGSAKI